MLKRLILRDFKSFRSAEIPLGPLTLLVGTNASGKSNVRDALRVLHGVGLGYTLAEILGEKYGPGGILQWRGIRGGVREVAYRDSGSFRVELDCDEPAARYSLSVDASDARSGPRITAEALHDSTGQNVLELDGTESRQPRSTTLRVLLIDPRTMKAIAPDTLPVLGRYLESPSASEAKRDARLAVGNVLRSLRFLDLDPEAMRVPSQPGQHILGDRGENLSSVLQAICEDESRKQTLLDWLRALTPMDAVDFEFLPDFSGKVLVHLVESNGHKMSALSASDGTLRFLALVAVLLSPDTGRIFFFEELDTGLHPTRLHLLIQLIQQACRNRGVQVIGTTHNPALLTFLDEQARKDALLVYRTESAPDSRIRRIADLPDIESILARQDLGQLHASGWLETAAEFSEPDDEGEEEGP